MKRDPAKEAERWFTQASDEFEDARLLAREGRYYLALFLFQQAAEKALKAFLYRNLPSAQVLITHSIAELLKLCQEIDPDFHKLEGSKSLDRYYIITRYPNGLPGGVPSRFFDDPQEAQRAKELAEAVLNTVRDRILSKGNP